MKQRNFTLVAVCIALVLCASVFADTIDLSSAGYNHNIVASPVAVTVVAFDYDTGGNNTTVNFRRLNDNGTDSWMMPVNFTSTYIEVDSDYGPYRCNVSISGLHHYVFTLNRFNGLWTLTIDGNKVDFVATSSTTTPQPDGVAVTVGAVVAKKYFSDETAESGQNAMDLGWPDAVSGIGSAGAYKVKFPQAGGSYIENLTVTPIPGISIHYAFDSVGATVADSSGNGNDATVLGNVTGYQFGRSGADAIFGGTSADALDVSATAVADRPSSAVTIAAWCNIEDLSGGQMSVFNAYGPREGDPVQNAFLYHVEIRPGNGDYRFVVRSQKNETIGDLKPVATMVFNKWFHLACTYDKAASDGLHLKVYIDGEQIGAVAANAVSDPNVGTDWSRGAAIGYTADSHQRNYKGQMDEFYMFNRALTPAEIATLASPTWLANGGFETGDITGWTEWNAGTAGTVDVDSTKSIELAPGYFETMDAASGDYSCYLEGGYQYGITQTVFVPAGTLVQIDALWAGTFTVGGYGWAEIKALTHAPGATYNLDESDMGGAYTGEWIYVAKTDTYGTNPKGDQSWDWEDAPAACPVDGNQFISQGEVVIATKFGCFPANGLVGGMGVDDITVKSLPQIAIAYGPDPEVGHNFLWTDVNDITLSWTAGYLAASHNVYLGTDETAVTNATTASAEFMGSVSTPTYEADPLIPGTTYFWRIDEVNGVDTWKGDVWSFTIDRSPKIDDPILWYQFNEGSGTTVADSAGGGFNGTMDNPTWDVGPDGSSCYANLGDFSRNFVDVPNDVFADVNELCSMSIWLWEADSNDYPDGAQYTAILRGGSLTDSERAVIFNNEGIGYTHWSDPIETGQWYTVTRMGADHDYNHDPTGWGDPPANYNSTWAFFGRDYYANPIKKWSHLTIVKDNTDYDGNGSLKVYKNGVLNVDNHRANCNKSMAGVDKFQLGGNYDDSNWYSRFTGKLDDFRVYDRALSAADVELLVGDYFKKAVRPIPADGAENVALDGTVLSWIAGQDAVSHQVYFGDNLSEVNNADVNSACYKGEQTGLTYALGALELMKTYYWRVDEVNGEGTVYKGDLWQFNSSLYIIVEDFESYDAEGNSINAVWAETGIYGDMQIALVQDPCLSPINSMYLRYQTPYDPYYAIAARSFSPAQDWTANGVKILTIRCYGDAANFALPVFVTIGDGTTDVNVVVDVNTLAAGWNEINVSLPPIATAGVDLTNITYMEIGFGNGTNVGMSDQKWNNLYIDDIALYPAKCVLSESSLLADITADCVVNYDDLAYITDHWLGTTSAEAIAAAGPVGLWLFDDPANLTKATIGSDLTTGIYNGTGGPLAAVAGWAAGDGAVMVPLNTYLIVDPNIVLVPGETRINEYTMVWDVNIPAASAYGIKRWVALCEFDVANLSTDVDISVIYSLGGGVPCDDGRFGTHQGWSPQLVKPDTWYQLAVSVSNGEFFNCYVNGELVISIPAEPVDGRYSIADTFHIFKDNDNEDPNINCSTFALFDRALTAVEIRSLLPIQLCKGDLNDDTAIDFADYAILANEWLVEDLWP